MGECHTLLQLAESPLTQIVLLVILMGFAEVVLSERALLNLELGPNGVVIMDAEVCPDFELSQMLPTFPQAFDLTKQPCVVVLAPYEHAADITAMYAKNLV